LLAKAALVPRAFAGIRRRQNGQDRRSANCAKAKRGTWFLTKIIAARDASKKCVTGVRLQRFWQAMVVSPVRTIMRRLCAGIFLRAGSEKSVQRGVHHDVSGREPAETDTASGSISRNRPRRLSTTGNRAREESTEII
jgi:hypothetical protein